MILSPKQYNAVSYALRNVASKDYFTEQETVDLFRLCDGDIMTFYDINRLVGYAMLLEHDEREGMSEFQKKEIVAKIKAIIKHYKQ